MSSIAETTDRGAPDRGSEQTFWLIHTCRSEGV
jgi:hypothetical protein